MVLATLGKMSSSQWGTKPPKSSKEQWVQDEWGSIFIILHDTEPIPWCWRKSLTTMLHYKQISTDARRSLVRTARLFLTQVRFEDLSNCNTMKISWLPETSAQQKCDTKIIVSQACGFVTYCLLHGKVWHSSFCTTCEWGLIKAFLLLFIVSSPMPSQALHTVSVYTIFLNHQNNICFL